MDLSASTTGGALVASVSGSGPVYGVAVTGMTGTGDVIASISAGAATDTAGNTSAASTSTDNTVTFDGVAPTVTLKQDAAQADPTNAGPIKFTVDFSENVTGFDAADVVLSGTASPATVSFSGSGATYSLSVDGMTGFGTVRLAVRAGAAIDGVGNPSGTVTVIDDTVTYVPGDPNPGVNNAPVLTAPATANAELGVVVPMTGANAISVVDPDAFLDPVSVTVTVADGTASATAASGATVAGSGTAAVVVTGSMAAVNATLAGLTITFTEFGSKAVTLTADDLGHSPAPALTATKTIAFTVVDTVPPVIKVPSVTVQANSDPGKAGAVVIYVVTVSDGGSPKSSAVLIEAAPPTATCSPASGSFFPIGTTTVTCIAKDSAGNTSTASFSVAVTDIEKPTITPPATQFVILPTGQSSGVVTYPVPTVADNSGTVTVSCEPQSGTVFPVGTTTVTCTATDPSGNSAAASFSVIVSSDELPRTGGGTGPLPLALMLLVIGLVMTAIGRRRRRV